MTSASAKPERPPHRSVGGKQWTRLALALLSGGLLFTTCETQFRDAVVFGTRSYVLNVLLDPETILEGILGDTGLIEDESTDATSP